jgi:hypothetical protein
MDRPLATAPALDVEISLSPLGELLAGLSEYFPLRIPVIDSEHPFFFDVSTWTMVKERFGENVEPSVTFKDLAGNCYTYTATLEIERSFGTMHIGSDPREEMAKSLQSIEKLLKRL